MCLILNSKVAKLSENAMYYSLIVTITVHWLFHYVTLTGGADTTRAAVEGQKSDIKT